MIDAGWLNIGSLILGLIAWGIPILNLIQYKKTSLKKLAICSLISLSSCALSLCMQIFYTGHLVKILDWTALMDTHGVVACVSLLLLVITILMNILTLTLSLTKK